MDDDPDGDRFDRVVSPDRTRIAAWTVASHDTTPDEERCVYEISVTDASTFATITHLTRRWSRDLHTGAESGSPLVGVAFAASGALLVLHFADGAREAVLLGAEPLPEDFGDVTMCLEAEPCSICGGAAWSTDVCQSCARYCERLLATGGVRPTLAQAIEEEQQRRRAARPDPPCAFCGSRGALAVSGPFGHACQRCVHKVNASR